ncbi:NUDIX hydrolase [Oceanobacillus chungangensis]|uniref:NUDIX hydrolase n=1 Tax=Oceanobacillus chungangensis TaxID=1229152 RepID=A0A3D8PMK9_9BACI|nr:NUDIX hydrolase [Oceanobacillus chungangensis]RDW16757.1 NUDIX hydrolase [Oceanobacillus chungangensis]
MDIVFKTDTSVFNYRVAGIWTQNGQVLIHKDVNDTNWSLPGGRVALGEDSQVALIREFQEELTMEIEVGQLCWIVENFFDYKGDAFHEISFYYEVSTSDSSLLQSEAFHGPEGERLLYKWVPIEKLSEYELLPSFLKSGLKALPGRTVHIINRDGDDK